MKKILMIISLIGGISLVNDMIAPPLPPLRNPTKDECTDVKVGGVCLITNQVPGHARRAPFKEFCKKNEDGTFSCRYATLEELACWGRKPGDFCVYAWQYPPQYTSKCTAQADGILTCP